MPKKRSKDEDEDEEEEEESEEEETKTSKKKLDSGKEKASTATGKLQKDKEGYWANLGEKEFKGSKTQKRLTVQSFKGTVSVHLREYYEKDGKMNPGKGITLSPEQFDMVIAMADQVKDAVKDVK